MGSLSNFLSDPFNANGDGPLSAWRLFLVIGLILALLTAWGFVLRGLSDIV